MLPLAYTSASFGSQATFHLVPIVLRFTDDTTWGGQLFTEVRVLRFSCDFYVVSEAIDASSREYKRVRETTGNRLEDSSCVLRCPSFGATAHEGLSLGYYGKVNNVSNYGQDIFGREVDAMDVVVEFFQT